MQRVVWTSLCLLLPLASASAQSQAPVGDLPVDPAVVKLDDVTRRLTVWLKEAPAFGVETTTRWSLDGSQPRSGVTRCRLAARQAQAFRLEVTAGADQKSTLVCASDGKQLTRLYRSGRLAVFSRHDGGLTQVLEDALTDGSLKGTGLNVILRPDVHAYLMASVSEVKDCGREQVEGQPADHFAAAWFGGSRIDFWIAAGDAPVMLRWKRVLKVDLGGQPHEMQMDSQLVWDLEAKVSDDQTTLQPPADAIEVRDLQTYLLKGGTDALLGQAAPLVPVKLPDGTDWDLAQHRGQQVVVLFFHATWAVPSTQDMPAVLAFVDEYANRGVAFYAVNVGESRDTVRAFMESLKYTHPVVLDLEQKTAEAYRVTSLPVTVLIGKDGTLQAVHVGTSPEARALIRQDLQQLREGKQPVETKK